MPLRLFNAKWFYIFHVTLFELGSAIGEAVRFMIVMILGCAIVGAGLGEIVC